MRRVAIVGVDKKALDVAGHLLSQSPQRCKIVGLYATKLPEATATFSKSDLYKGSLEMLLQNRNRLKLDDVIVALDLDRYAEPEALFGRLHQMPVNTYYCLPYSLFSRAAHTQDTTYRLPLILLFRHPLDGPELLLKRGLDLVGSVGFELSSAPIALDANKTRVLTPRLALAYQVDALGDETNEQSLHAHWSDSPSAGEVEVRGENRGMHGFKLDGGAELKVAPNAALYANLGYEAFSTGAQFNCGGGVKLTF